MNIMDDDVRFNMSKKELDRLQVLQRVENKEIKNKDAAKMLHLSKGQFQKILKKYRKHGPIGILSKKTGNCGRKPFSVKLKEHVLNLVEDKYYDFTPTFLGEKLLEIHGVIISRETLRQWLIGEGFYQAKIKKKNLHRARERRAPKYTLLVFIDDATSKLLSLLFVPAETTFGYFRALKQQLLIYAHSPQAKGRVERASLTLQDRLPKELRLRNISDIDSANQFLETFRNNYNKQFAKLHASDVNFHRKLNYKEHENLDNLIQSRLH